MSVVLILVFEDLHVAWHGLTVGLRCNPYNFVSDAVGIQRDFRGHSGPFQC